MTPRPRLLPIPIPPALHETLESYLRRLSATNRVHPEDLKHHLDFDPTLPIDTISPNNLNGLSIVTGYPPTELARALPELDHRHTTATLFRRQPMPACPRCTSRHRGGPVTRYYPHHVRTCPKHLLWIGHQPARHHQPRTFVDISAAANVIAAQTRHRRLARRRGTSITAHAFTYARRIWTRTPQLSDTVGATLDPSHLGKTGSPEDPKYQAAIYPRLVTITTLLTSPYWRDVALDHRLGGAFFAEAGRILLSDRHYQPPPGHPLRTWLDDLATLQAEPASLISALARFTEP
ncbi:TniQ family protein [Nocardia pseudovaccinii]|uniref:TniQ family protein n=1 Tax=Nocardia pseudovaccinii TaxID=189540 RepID=UPI003D8CE0EF